MKIWLTRHGQTNLNKKRLMQGLTDEPLNETGIAQARGMREKLLRQECDARTFSGTKVSRFGMII